MANTISYFSKKRMHKVRTTVSVSSAISFEEVERERERGSESGTRERMRVIGDRENISSKSNFSE